MILRTAITLFRAKLLPKAALSAALDVARVFADRGARHRTRLLRGSQARQHGPWRRLG